MIPRPIAERNPYEVKPNDVLTGNMPFATNVSYFHEIIFT